MTAVLTLPILWVCLCAALTQVLELAYSVVEVLVVHRTIRLVLVVPTATACELPCLCAFLHPAHQRICWETLVAGVVELTPYISSATLIVFTAVGACGEKRKRCSQTRFVLENLPQIFGMNVNMLGNCVNLVAANTRERHFVRVTGSKFNSHPIDALLGKTTPTGQSERKVIAFADKFVGSSHDSEFLPTKLLKNGLCNRWLFIASHSRLTVLCRIERLRVFSSVLGCIVADCLTICIIEQMTDHAFFLELSSVLIDVVHRARAAVRAFSIIQRCATVFASAFIGQRAILELHVNFFFVGIVGILIRDALLVPGLVPHLLAHPPACAVMSVFFRPAVS